jgi:serine/threonine protein kinase
MVDRRHRAYRQGDEPVAGFQLDEFLGRGGFGEVWRAVGPGGVQTAIKIIPDLDRKHGGKELKALRLLRDIRHPNLVPLIAFWLKNEAGELISDGCGVEPTAPDSARRGGATRGDSHSARGTLLALPAADPAPAAPRPAELVIAMGLAEKSLFDRLRECRDDGLAGVPLDELLTYLEDAARAIDVLNTRHEIQHCDIKPQNILLLSGAAQVCDFGLAKMIGEVRETSMGAGTIAYGAPEVLLGKGPTSTTDQYSLAISYFELRTGDLPFGSERISDVLQAKQHGTVDLSVLPAGERAVIERAAAIEPAERFASCGEMVKALRAAVEGQSRATESAASALVETRRLTAHASARRWRSAGAKRWELAGAGLGISAVLGGIVAVAQFRSSAPASQRGTASMSVLGVFGAPAERVRAHGIAEEPLGQVNPAGHEPATPDAFRVSSPIRPGIESGEGAAQEPSAADRELAKADRVLAEADATLAAAKAALAASQAVQAAQSPHPAPPAAGQRIEQIATATQSVATNTESIATATRATADNSRLIAESTKEIALSLDKLREQLSQAASRGGVIEDPQSPSEIYHNARTFEARGDYSRARQAYLQLCSYRLQVVDPYMHFVSLLRLQEGRAGARETFYELAHTASDSATRFALLLLAPDESRDSLWKSFVAEHPDFAPAIFEWSREYSRERLGAQGLADVAREKELLERFIQMADEGKLLRHFLDQSAALEMLDEAKSRLAAVQHFDPTALEHPVRLTATPSNTSWTLLLTIAESAREIQFRVDDEELYQTTGFLPGIDQRTGSPPPNPSLQLPPDAPATRLYVKYSDVRGREQGPFELVFQPNAERLAFGKRTLEQFPHNWISIRDFDGKTLAYFTHLVSFRPALREIRYAVDSEELNQRFPLLPASEAKLYEVPAGAQTYIELPAGTNCVIVQLVYEDGTQSDRQKFPVSRSTRAAAQGQPPTVPSRESRPRGQERSSAPGSDARRFDEIPTPKLNRDADVRKDPAPRMRLGVGF